MIENAVTASPAETDIGSSASQVVLINLDDLEPDADQGRKHFDADALQGLARSLKESGVLQPLLVKRLEGQLKHQIIDGERRWRAAKLAGIISVPCMVRAGEGSALDQLVANFQREDLNPVEKAEQLRRTMAESGMDAKQVAARAGLSYHTTMKYLRLGDGPEILRTAVSSGLRVTVEGTEKTRNLEWANALEALRIYTTVLEPVDPSPEKKTAIARLEALIRRALSEGWTKARWLKQAKSVACQRDKRRGRSAFDAAPAAPSRDCAQDSGKDAPSVDGGRLVRPRRGEVRSAARSLPDVLEMVEVALARANADELAVAVRRLDLALARAAEAIGANEPFLRDGNRFVVFLDRLVKGQLEPAQRAALIEQVEVVLATARGPLKFAQ